MIVHIVNVKDLVAFKTKNHPPIATHRDRPESIALTLKLVQSQTGQGQISWMRRGVKKAEYQPQPVSVRGLNSRFTACYEKSLQAFMGEPLDQAVYPPRDRLQQ
jgi:hypothetical protein